jgi:very-short-patch-repair endonuclease
VPASTDVSAPPSAPPSGGVVDRARRQWIARLIDFSQRNNLLYFRTLKTGTLDLTFADRNALAELLGGNASAPIKKLLPDADEEQITAKLKQIARKARENLDDRGIDTLFVAAGIATWKPEEGKNPPQSAVLLVPVAVESKRRALPALKRVGDLKINEVLLQVLETNFGCKLDANEVLAAADVDPESEEDAFDLDRLLARLTELAKDVPQFAVRRAVALGNFSFQKTAMVRDLRELGAELSANPIVAALAGDDAARSTVGSKRHSAGLPDPREFDRQPPENEFFILDSDSSQHRAVMSALSGSSGVIQGPPGTGKSQVIANLIASAGGAGKRVLFVAEKRAALEVVLKRLENHGLGHLALDLHGADASRKQIAAKLRDALNYVARGEPIVSEEIFRAFKDRRDKLNQHAQRLHGKRKPAELSVFELQARLLRSQSCVDSKTRFRGQTLMKLTPPIVGQIKDALAEAGGWSDLFLGTSTSPWANAVLDDGASAQQAVDRVERVHGKFPRVVERIRAVLDPLSSQPITNIGAAWQRLKLINDVTGFLHHWRAELFAEDLDLHASSLEPSKRGLMAALFASLFSGRFKQAKRGVSSHRTGAPLSARDLASAVEQARDLKKQWTSLGITGMPRLVEGADELKPQLEQLVLGELEPLSKILPTAVLTTPPFDEAMRRVESLRADAHTARQIPKVRAIRKSLDAYTLGSFINELKTADVPAEHWPAVFEHAWLRSCLEQAWADEPELAAFRGDVHSRFVGEFVRLDRERLQLAAKRVARKHVATAAQTLQSLTSQANVVRHEAEKKMRHIPFRRLMEQASDVVTTLFPCFMCSPLSVSQLLPGEKRHFDIVVFDEASQVLPEDAVASLMRGTQAVVAGDQHQLPPTPFFADGGTDEEDGEATFEEDATQGFESLLATMSTFAPSWMLRWHYRSRDERLIAFSNRHIYDSRLITFPGPGRVVPVAHVHVDDPHDQARDGDEESGSAEVRRVVELIVAHAEQQLARPDAKDRRSLGVIALGIPHTRRIQAALDAAVRDRPDLDEFFDENAAEAFFVKNLERVQGDERDSIILTLGVGKDRGGRVSLTRFGPLNNRDHGYRRLNVAVTRARERMTLVSSFTHQDLDATKQASRGVELLRQYLQFAASGGNQLGDGAGSEIAPNDFEADIATVLGSKGISVAPQWGTSGYRIDLVAAHPQRPGRFVLAIECDGASYHSAPTARERDRLRQQHLEALGWRFHRIWSTDWFCRKGQEVERALSAYQQAVSFADAQDQVATAAP